jgi:hypothetical protein
MSMADRCGVIYRGRLLAHWPREQLDRDKVGLAMGGASNGGDPEPAAAGGGRA